MSFGSVRQQYVGFRGEPSVQVRLLRGSLPVSNLGFDRNNVPDRE
jgi:hypothetical protein